MFLCQPLFTYSHTHPSTHLFTLLPVLIHLPTFIYLLLIIDLPSTYLSTYTPNYLSLTNVIKKTMCKKGLVIITNVYDDEKMLRFNINLIANKHFKIIGVNDNLKN